MSQSDGRIRGVIGRKPDSNSFARLPNDPAAPEVTALLVLAVSLFSLIVLGNLAGLW
ncbi:hypothetical protein [Natrinema sp. 1APR25-10V2]|uniref:hypothetical protein n=1 Tax=Natrinema sp. 1APR25-10V2 TaxID=2951081 RepID=UPI002875D343|nr:hypothetical protein [Natrinema sp. 1APR25-10V2]MDS0473646.1 hypothetical protein [Natrinema sp. 1APR25-10V2]